MITSFKRLIAALAVILPVSVLVISPVMAASHSKSHHTTAHRASHMKKTTAAG